MSSLFLILLVMGGGIIAILGILQYGLSVGFIICLVGDIMLILLIYGERRRFLADLKNNGILDLTRGELIKIIYNQARKRMLSDKDNAWALTTLTSAKVFTLTGYAKYLDYFQDNQQLKSASSPFFEKYFERDDIHGVFPKYRLYSYEQSYSNLSSWDTSKLKWLLLKMKKDSIGVDAICFTPSFRNKDFSQEEKLERERSVQAKKAEDIRIKNEQQRIKKEQKEKFDNLILKHKTLIDSFFEVAYREVSALDEFGEERSELFFVYLDKFLHRLAVKENFTTKDVNDLIKNDYKSYRLYMFEKLVVRLKKDFEVYKNNQRGQVKGTTSSLNELTGQQFEVYVKEVLQRAGVEKIKGTKVTGDQGADLLIEYENKKIAIQIKRYQSKVGNSAVQEITAALKYYGCDEGWVITNSSFTKSAISLAGKNNVKLIDGIKFNSMFNNQSEPSF